MCASTLAGITTRSSTFVEVFVINLTCISMTRRVLFGSRMAFNHVDVLPTISKDFTTSSTWNHSIAFKGHNHWEESLNHWPETHPSNVKADESSVMIQNLGFTELWVLWCQIFYLCLVDPKLSGNTEGVKGVCGAGGGGGAAGDGEEEQQVEGADHLHLLTSSLLLNHSQMDRLHVFIKLQLLSKLRK